MKWFNNQLPKEDLAQVLLIFSFASVIMAAVGFAFGDIWLDSTRWLLVAITLGVWSVYFRCK